MPIILTFFDKFLSTQVFDHAGTMVQTLTQSGITILGRIIAAILIFIIGRYLIKLVMRILSKLLDRHNFDPGVKSFLKSLVNVLLIMLLLVAIASKLGIETTSFAALLASFGVAIGMAMSGNLSNLVSGMIILLFKPYRVGDWIEVNGTLGQVSAIEIFHTILRTAGAANIYFSNGTMTSAVIKNFSKESTIRLDADYSIDYDTNFKDVENALLNLASGDPRILSTPAPAVAISKLADSTIDLTLRIWVKTEDYWTLKGDINRMVYDAFQQAGITFPYPVITIQNKD